MPHKQKKAIVLGATGLVGNYLLHYLLQDERYGHVLVFSRRALAVTHPKLKVVITNLLELPSQADAFLADEVFCCIGTTKAKTPDLESYRKIDLGIPLAAAQLCQQNGIPTLIVVSAMGANSNSRFFYNKIKGQMEETVGKQGIAKLHFVRPSLIGGQRAESRFAEDFGKFVFKALGFLMLGPFKHYRAILPQTIAKAMLWLANNPYKTTIVPSATLKTLASHGAFRD